MTDAASSHRGAYHRHDIADVDIEDVLDELVLLRRPAWHADAACREHPEVNFFPDRGENWRPAKAICSGCLVREECVAFALEHGERHGIWGGTSYLDRRKQSRSAGVDAAAAAPAPIGDILALIPESSPDPPAPIRASTGN